MKNLQRLNINTLDELALHLRSTSSELSKLSKKSKFMYIHKIESINGKERELHVPTGRLKVIQKNINSLLQRLELPDEIVAYRKRKSIIDNARIHKGAEYIITNDIENFYPSVYYINVYKRFIYHGCSPDVAKMLTELTTHKGALPVGAPSSPAVANLMTLPMLNRIKKLLQGHNAKISFYSDDFTLSGSKRVLKLNALICKIVESEGYRIKKSKCKIVSNKEEQVITGIRIDKKKYEIPKKKYDEIKDSIKNLPPTNNENDFEKAMRSIQGKLTFVRRINAKQYSAHKKSLDKKLNAISAS